MCSHDNSGVPTLTPANMKILLRGRGVEGGRERDNNVVQNEVNTTDSNSNVTNVNNKKAVKPSRSKKHKLLRLLIYFASRQ